jgi:hypothetical protein
MRVRDLPRFPPPWVSLTSGSRAGLIGTLKHVELEERNRYLIIVVEEKGDYLVGEYHADEETLRKLFALIEKSVGKPLVDVAGMEMGW